MQIRPIKTLTPPEYPNVKKSLILLFLCIFSLFLFFPLVHFFILPHPQKMILPDLPHPPKTKTKTKNDPVPRPHWFYNKNYYKVAL
jgi:hypothetical protein